jgi:vacuolar protein-sorting-associated protein 4
MENKFLSQGIEIVTEAIRLDNAKDYDGALAQYRKSLEHFMLAIKYEKNEHAKKIIIQRMDGYMHRAEQLKDKAGGPAPKRKAAAEGGSPRKGGGGGEGKGGEDGGDDEEDPDKAKLRGALAGAIVSEKPDVKWDDVAGLDAAKDALKEAVILPARFPQLFTGKRRPWSGILLYGPPGTGKSYLAKAVATEADSTFFSVSSSDLVSKWQGESERLVRNLFEMARERRPAIIFIDEVDSMCSSRGDGESDSVRRIKTEFLVQMQGVGKTHDGILVLGATNTPWNIDAAMRRRFEKRIYIPLPEDSARARIFNIHLGDTPNSLHPEDFDELGALTKGFSGSDISVAVRGALMEPLRKCRTAKHFRKNGDGKYVPVMEYPPCPHCHPKVSGCREDCPGCHSECRSCHAKRMKLFDIDPDELAAPDVTLDDFRHVLEHATLSVGADELTRFVEWTDEFGEEGA